MKGELRTDTYAQTKLTPHNHLVFDATCAPCPARRQVRMNGIQVAVNNVWRSQFRKESSR